MSNPRYRLDVKGIFNTRMVYNSTIYSAIALFDGRKVIVSRRRMKAFQSWI